VRGEMLRGWKELLADRACGVSQVGFDNVRMLANDVANQKSVLLELAAATGTLEVGGIVQKSGPVLGLSHARLRNGS
jgi:hypothetical protein